MTNQKTFGQAQKSPHDSRLWDVSAVELSSKLGGNFQLIDVRGQDEFTGELGHITGSTLLPLPEIETRAEEISLESPVVFICRSGARSTNAGIWALNRGHKEVYNLAGGMLAWNEQGLKTEK